MRLAAVWVWTLILCCETGLCEEEVSKEPSLDLKRVDDNERCVCVPVYRCDFQVSNDGSGLIDIRVDRRGCPELLDVCCPTTSIRPPSYPTQPSPHNLRCGESYRHIDTRVTGNSGARYGQYPWMAALLGPGRRFICGGSLIHPQVVLTAAHCVNQIRARDLTVRLGEWNSQAMTEPLPVQNVGVRTIVSHEQFTRNSLFNDIALLFLQSPARLADNIRTICLPEPNEIMDGRICQASGWGKNAFGREGKYSAILKTVELPIVPREECLQALRRTRLGAFFRLHISFLCAGGEVNKDTCTGDGGGPLVCPRQRYSSVYTQAGIVSWGIDCGRHAPAAYTNVALFRSWIDLQLLRHGLFT